MIEFLTGILVAITAFYAWVTHRMLRVNIEAVEAVRDQNERMGRPYVTATTVVGNELDEIFLRIANVGRSSAEGLRVTLDQSFPLPLKRDLANFWLFNNEVPTFPPGTEVTFSLGSATQILAGSIKESGDPIPQLLSVHAAYRGGTRYYQEVTTIDLRQYLSSMIPRDPVAKELGRLNGYFLERKIERETHKRIQKWMGESR